MLKHMKALSSCNLYLYFLHIFISEFLYFAALGANQMVMMFSQMAVLIAGLAVVKSAFVGKTETAHKLQSFADKLGV